MVSAYGRGIHPFTSPVVRDFIQEESKLPPAEHSWGALKPHHFDFSFGTDVRRSHPDFREQIFRSVRVTGSGILQNEGKPDQPFQGGAILVERAPGGEVRVFSSKTFLRHFERSEGAAFQLVEEVSFQAPAKRAKDDVVGRRRAA